MTTVDVRLFLVMALALCACGSVDSENPDAVPSAEGKEDGVVWPCTKTPWQIAVLDGPNGRGAQGLEPSLALDGWGGVHVTYAAWPSRFGQLTSPPSSVDVETSLQLKWAYRASMGPWNPPAIIDSSPGVGHESSMASDARGGLHVVYYDFPNVQLKYLYRRPLGAWEAPIALPTRAYGGGVRTSLAVDSEGGVHITTLDVDQGGISYLYKPAGGSFSPPELAVESNVGWQSIAIDRGDTVHLVFNRAAARAIHDGVVQYDSYLLYANKPAGGAWSAPTSGSWDTEPSLDPSLHALEPSIAVDRAGTLHVAYGDTSAAQDTHVKYLSRTAAGAWSSPAMVDASGWMESPRIAVDSVDGLHLTYYWIAGAGSQGGPKYVHRRAGGAWEAPQLIEAVSETGSSNASLSVDRRGGVHVAYLDSDHGRLKYAYACP